MHKLLQNVKIPFFDVKNAAKSPRFYQMFNWRNLRYKLTQLKITI